MLEQILLGTKVILQPANLLFCFIGAVIGTVVGVLPGIGPLGALSILLPATFRMTPVESIVMFAGVYYGAMYGGSTTSILLNIPGETASIVTCIDGYQMARQGRAGPALGMSAMGSFIGGTVAILLTMLLAVPIINVALKFSAPEYFSLMILSIVLLTFLSSKSMTKSLIVAVFGIFLGTIGTDPVEGLTRFTFKTSTLLDGLNVVPVAMGLFGIGELLTNIESGVSVDVFETKIGRVLPSLKDWMESKWAIVRGTILGFLLGVIPGGGSILASFVSYAVEKKVAKHPERFGKGAIEGVAGPETANNAGAQASFIPLLTFGIPSNVVTAILLSAFMIHGLTPGPLLLKQNPDVFWGLIMSMYVGNIMLLILNLPLIGLWVKVLKIPYVILFPIIILFCLVGAYSVNNDVNDILILIIFGLVGYLMKKFDYDAAVLVLALVLGPMIEKALRQSLIMYRGSLSIFVHRPISLGLLLLALALVLYPMIPKRKNLSLAGKGSSEGV